MTTLGSCKYLRQFGTESFDRIRVDGGNCRASSEVVGKLLGTPRV